MWRVNNISRAFPTSISSSSQSLHVPAFVASRILPISQIHPGHSFALISETTISLHDLLLQLLVVVSNPAPLIVSYACCTLLFSSEILAAHLLRGQFFQSRVYIIWNLRWSFKHARWAQFIGSLFIRRK